MAGKEWYVDDKGNVKSRNQTKAKNTNKSQGSLRAAEFANPTYAQYEIGSPSQGPGDTTDATNLGVSSQGKPGKGGTGGNQYKSMLDALKKLSEMSQGTINQSMNTLTERLQAQANPFANVQVANTQTAPDFAKLLQSQGVSTDPLQQFASAINAQNTGQADAFKNLVGTLSGFNQTNQEGMISDVAQQRADLLNALQGNVFGTGSKLIKNKNVDRNAITQMLLAAIKNRA